MGELIFTETVKPFRAYIWNNDEEGKKIILNAYTETIEHKQYIRKISITENEFPKFLELIKKIEKDLSSD